MQQAIALVKKYENRLIPMGVLSYNLELLLEKEKEQIIEAHNNSVISPYTELYVHKIQGKSPITKGEEYYNKKYNQNN